MNAKKEPAPSPRGRPSAKVPATDAREYIGHDRHEGLDTEDWLDAHVIAEAKARGFRLDHQMPPLQSVVGGESVGGCASWAGLSRQGVGRVTATSAQQTSWWSVHTFVAPMLTAVGSWPMVGTPEWCALPDDDPRKLAAIYDAARHWSVRLETRQQALAEASRDVSGAVDWAAIAREIPSRSACYIRREAS